MPTKDVSDLKKQVKVLKSELGKLRKEVEGVERLGNLLEEHKRAINELMDSGVTVMKSLKKFYQEQKEMYQILGQMKKEMEELKSEVDGKDEKKYEKDYKKTEGYV